MQLTLKQLKNLPVYSQNQDYLGKIKDIEINIEMQSVSKYFVTSSSMIKKIADKELIISPSQVVSIDEQKMVVEDSVGRETEFIKEPVTLSSN